MTKLYKNLNAEIIGGLLEKVITSRSAFWSFSILFIIYIWFGLANLYSPGGPDYWEHLATFYNLSLDPFSQGNAYIQGSKSFFLNSPYHLFWGLVARFIGIHPFWLLSLIGSLNGILLIAASISLSKFLTDSKKYSLIISLSLLFFWYLPWNWSGFYHFGLLPLTAIYPFWFAFPATLIIISRMKVELKIIGYLFVSILGLIIFLIHPLTGSFLFLSIFVKVITAHNVILKKKIITLTIPISAFLISLLWPYYSVGGAILNVSDYNHFLGKYWMFYVQIWKSILPAFLGLLYIPIAIKSKRIDFAILGLILTLIIFIFNYFVLHNQYLSRYLIYITFFLQISIALLIKYSKTYKFAVVITFYSLLIIFGFKQLELSSTYLGIVQDIKAKTNIGFHSNKRIFNSYKEINKFVSRDDVILAPLYTSWSLPGITGNKIIASPHKEVFENHDDYISRKDDINYLFNIDIPPNDKISTILKYDADYFLVPAEFQSTSYDSISILLNVYTTNDYALYKIN